MVHLLRAIPRAPESPWPVEEEIDAVAPFVEPAQPLFLVKEALQYLLATRHPRAEGHLLAQFRAVDRALQQMPAAAEDRPVMLIQLDRTAAVVAKLVEAVEENLPRGMLGRLLPGREGVLTRVITALSSTRAPEVVELLGPFAATFAFVRGRKAEAGDGEKLPVTQHLVEGMRRHGELHRALALVPGDGALEATGKSPSTVPDEPDYDFVVNLWQQVCKGASPREVEETLAVDSYRVFRCLTQWIEEGALRLRPAMA